VSANTGTFTYWRYGQPATEFEVSATVLDPGADLSASVSGTGVLVPILTVGAAALVGTLDGTGSVGDLLTAGSALLGSTLDGGGTMVADLVVGSILGRTKSLTMRYGVPSDFVAPRSGHTGTMSFWRDGRPAEFRAQAGPLAAPASGVVHRFGRWASLVLRRILR
jgi:hypothetical protein